MTRRPRDVSGAVLVKRLERAGFYHVRTEGSHAVCTAESHGKFSVYIPLHKQVAIGSLHNILRRVAAYLKVSVVELTDSLEL